MKKSQIAAQMYSFRAFFGMPKEFSETLTRIKEMGYDAIQVSPSMPQMPAKELRRILDDKGLIPCSATKKGASPADNTDEVIEYLQ